MMMLDDDEGVQCKYYDGHCHLDDESLLTMVIYKQYDYDVKIIQSQQA